MTLCVAFKFKKNIYLGSDSRISVGDKYADYGIKVTPVHIRIYEPSEEGTQPQVAFESTYGMCFAGDFAGASFIREFLAITMQRLQYVPTFSELSFEYICRTINKLYREVSTGIKNQLENDSSIDFFLSGYCPKENKLMLAKFYIDYGENIDKFEPKASIMDPSLNEFIDYIGSGEDKYGLYLDIHKDKSLPAKPILALKSLIDSQSVFSVGGNVQLGQFDANNEFYVSGIVKHVENEQGFIDSIQYCFAGIDMNSSALESSGDDYIVMGTYIDPYR
ncbi:TPA: hypothetical protein PX804_003477 [Vibrio cholerae]|nr:hypothetical protein [Vibrio cholerae]